MLMARSFSAWKSQAMLRLIAIEAAHKGDAKIKRDVDTLITKLTYLKAKELYTFLALVHEASKDCEDFLNMIPSEEEVIRWIEKGGEE
jgi:hypothetical protein